MTALNSGEMGQDAPATQAQEARLTSKKRIGILIVAYNAVTTLVDVLERIPAHVWEDVTEVAVFDDASPDATHILATGYKILSGNSKLTLAKQAKNLGYGGNQKAGYTYFIEQGFDIVVLLHGDGQYAPEMLDKMYLPIARDEAEAVFGSRMMADYGGPLKGGMPFYKYIGNRILTAYENAVLGMQLTEFHSGYRAYSLHALRQIDFSHMTDDFHFDTEIIIKFRHQGLRIKEVPIPTYYGNEICYVNGMKYAKDVVRAVRRYKRTINAFAIYPEFAEYITHYPLKQSRFSSHDLICHLVGRGQTVLDLGCGKGFLAEELTAQGNHVVGVDTLPETQNCAVESYYSADLNAGLRSISDTLGQTTFSRVLLADVLEHLTTPDNILRDCHAVLDPTGQLIVSLPNVANISVRLALLCGRFNYSARGILDKTHVHFYTRKTARALLRDNGYEILKEDTTIIPVELVLGLAPQSPLVKALGYILRFCTRLMPGLCGYQLLFVARSGQTTPSAT